MIAAAGSGAGLSGFRDVLCRPKAILFAGLLAASLSGCKTSGTTDAIGTGAAAPAAPISNVVGTGPVAIAIFTDSMSSPQLAADQRDGAALAVSQLARDQITLTIYDAGANGADIGSDVKVAMTSGARLLIGPPSLSASPVWAKTDAKKRPPAIMLATAPVKPVESGFWLVSSETDSAAEIAGYAATAGKKQILVAAPAQLAPNDIAQMKAAIEAQSGVFLGVVTVPPAAPLNREMLAQADAVVLFGAAPTVMLTPLHGAGLRSEAWILGTSEWKPAAYAGEAYFAALDQNGFGHIAGGFKTAYGRALTEEAAYAFDAVAVASGIVRAKGAEGMAAAELKSQIGFSGATGPFRFKNDGRVQRRFSIYKVTGGIAKLHDPAPGGF